MRAGSAAAAAHAAAMRATLCIALLLVTAAASAADGMNPAATRRLELLIASLTDPRKSVHEPAVVGLVALGEQVLPDLQVLAGDPEVGVRSRVAAVATGIGGPKTYDLLERLASDRNNLVREVAVLGLGRTRTEAALELLLPLIQDPVPEVRDSAALALGQLGDLRAIPELSLWPAAGGAQASLQLEPYPTGDRQLKRIRKSMQASLKALVVRPDAIPYLIELLPTLSADRQRALLEATWEIGDPRLSPLLAELLDSPNPEVRGAAAVSLAANGDGRALGALCGVAALDGDLNVREAAADTLRRLTGHRAAAGPAWTLWWEDHAQAVESNAERDRFIAELHDPKRTVTADELARFSPEELMPLVTGVLGDGSNWWSRAAWRILRQDDVSRWTPLLLGRYDETENERDRVELVVVLDGLGDPAAIEGLALRLEDLRAIRENREARRRGSLYAALVLAVEGGPEPKLTTRR